MFTTKEKSTKGKYYLCVYKHMKISFTSFAYKFLILCGYASFCVNMECEYPELRLYYEIMNIA